MYSLLNGDRNNSLQTSYIAELQICTAQSTILFNLCFGFGTKFRYIEVTMSGLSMSDCVRLDRQVSPLPMLPNEMKLIEWMRRENSWMNLLYSASLWRALVTWRNSPPSNGCHHEITRSPGVLLGTCKRLVKVRRMWLIGE